MHFIPHHTLVTAPEKAPAKWMLVLHGVLGSGSNWRTFAKRIVSARPEWGVALVDLRMHGASQDAPPPHTLESAAQDLLNLEGALVGPVRGVLGHSFGGKVALEFVSRRNDDLEVAFIVDANPGVRDPARLDANGVVATLASLPDPLPSRERFFELVGARGIDRKTAEWLAMNLRPSGDAFRIRLNLEAIRELLDDYAARDEWGVIETVRARPALHVIVGGRSESFSTADRARLESDARTFPNVFMHVVAKADHNVHVDAPDELLALITDALTVTS